ncbi:hypothetical protein FF100_29175 [Methylobacterium terricola]|uniref:Uncharacterized protein n=1 Tax=Methylobacterium terricola TaxID=2583531 RepID=A0A5C4LB68_9HYPH|nr:hypothetical protein [Methylobacterium terricola]TNC08418.1 hypothetical protein FF100_29175 [Methylobacterium terricola]
MKNWIPEMTANILLREITYYVPEEEKIGAAHQISVVENLRGKLNDFEAALDLIAHIDSEIAQLTSERTEFLKNSHLKDIDKKQNI